MLTHSRTYDPVVGVRPLPRVRLLSPLRTPPPGRALVPDAGPALTVRPGEQVPDARYGVYQRMYLVDTTEHRLVLDLRLAGREAVGVFHCRVELMCQVVDPAVVVARGIRDMSAAWYGAVHERLRNVSRGFGAGQPRAAQDALSAALRDVIATRPSGCTAHAPNCSPTAASSTPRSVAACAAPGAPGPRRRPGPACPRSCSARWWPAGRSPCRGGRRGGEGRATGT